MGKTVLAVVVALGLGGAVGLAALMAATPPRDHPAIASHPAWTEVPWPFLMDQWGKGKAFRCKATDCGADVDLYVRAKIGFCNCATGVADDDELERVADVSLLDNRYSALAAGRPIKVGRMEGRSRPYVVTDGSRQRAIAIAFNERCDVIVATAVLAHDRPSAFEPAVLAFLNGDIMMRWAEVTLGL
jgi:hypothetical protein